MRDEKETTVQTIEKRELLTTHGGFRPGYESATEYEVQDVRSTGTCRIPQIARR